MRTPRYVGCFSSRRGRFRLLEPPAPPPLVSSKDCDDEAIGELGPVPPELLQVVQASDTGDSARSSSIRDEHCAKLAVTSKLM
jgi:hypothetical protein